MGKIHTQHFCRGSNPNGRNQVPGSTRILGLDALLLPVRKWYGCFLAQKPGFSHLEQPEKYRIYQLPEEIVFICKRVFSFHLCNSQSGNALMNYPNVSVIIRQSDIKLYVSVASYYKKAIWN